MDPITIIAIATPLLVTFLTGILRGKSIVIWVTAFTVLVVTCSALHLYAMRIPLSEHQVWLGVLFADVIPTSVAFSLTRMLPHSTPRWKIGLGGLMAFVATLFLSITIGGRLGAIYR